MAVTPVLITDDDDDSCNRTGITDDSSDVIDEDATMSFVHVNNNSQAALVSTPTTVPFMARTCSERGAPWSLYAQEQQQHDCTYSASEKQVYRRHDDSDFEDDNETRTINSILTTMRRFPHDAEVQELACKRLWILSWEDENAILIGKTLQGIPLVLAALERHRECALAACQSLQNLAAIQDNAREIAECGGIPLMVLSCLTNYANPELVKSVCVALANLASYREEISQAKGVQAMVNVATYYRMQGQAGLGVVRAAQDALMAFGCDLNVVVRDS